MSKQDAGQEVLRLEQLKKAYNVGKPTEVEVLHGLDLQLCRSDFAALIGSSGSGKSTLLRIAAGLASQSSGEVWLGDMQIQNPKQKLVAGYDEIKLIHQDYQLYPNATVAENIARPLLNFDPKYRQPPADRGRDADRDAADPRTAEIAPAGTEHGDRVHHP